MDPFPVSNDHSGRSEPKGKMTPVSPLAKEQPLKLVELAVITDLL